MIASQPNIQEYINSSKDLKFDIHLFPNLFSFTQDPDSIEKKKNKECDDWFKGYLLNVALQFRFGEYQFKDQIVIARAIIK